MLGFAERLRAELASTGGPWKPLVLLGSERPFQFRARPSSIIVPGVPIGVIACMPLLEGWDIPSRLASSSDLPGCFEGPVIMLADCWLKSLGTEQLSQVEVFYCGTAATLNEVAELAGRYGVPYQTTEPV